MTVRLLVLADTHMPRGGRELSKEVCDLLPRVDGIVHLGDFTEAEVAHRLESYAPLYAVHGNNDAAEVRTRFPATRSLTVEGHELVLIHGDKGGRTALEAARKIRNVDAVLFGHSHRPWCSQEDGRLLFNPGSPTDRRWNPHRSFGLLEVGDSIRPWVILL
jgi:putative phosphoesterase